MTRTGLVGYDCASAAQANAIDAATAHARTGFMSLPPTRPSYLTESGEALDVPDLSLAPQPVEPAQLRDRRGIRCGPRGPQRAREPPAVARSIGVRLPVKLDAVARELVVHAGPVEQQGVQLGGEAAGILLAQQPDAGDVLVDLRLELELERRDGPVVRCVPDEVDEVADALERGPVVGDVAFVQRLKRIRGGQ